MVTWDYHPVRLKPVRQRTVVTLQRVCLGGPRQFDRELHRLTLQAAADALLSRDRVQGARLPNMLFLRRDVPVVGRPSLSDLWLEHDVRTWGPGNLDSEDPHCELADRSAGLIDTMMERARTKESREFDEVLSWFLRLRSVVVRRVCRNNRFPSG